MCVIAVCTSDVALLRCLSHGTIPTSALPAVCAVSICTGILLGFLVDKFLTPNWRAMFLAGTPLACALLVTFIFVTPFSPRWLASKGRDAEALKVRVRKAAVVMRHCMFYHRLARRQFAPCIKRTQVDYSARPRSLAPPPTHPPRTPRCY